MEGIIGWDGFLLFFIPFLFFVTKTGSKLANKVCRLFFLPTKKEKDLLAEAIAVKQEINQVSMMDEFAKHAKLQRRLNQIKLSLESDVKARNTLHSSMTRFVTFGIYGIVALIYIYTLYQYGRAYPVLVMPSRWFFPLNYIFSYPTGIQGAISIPAWSLICRCVISTFIK